MSKQKKLTSDVKKIALDMQPVQKKLATEYQTTKITDENQPKISSEGNENNKDIQGVTLSERIINSTKAGGLLVLPKNFDQDDGDWHICKSDNYFTRLYLDYRQYSNILPEIVNNNYQILFQFWNKRINEIDSATDINKKRIIRKYSDEHGSRQTIIKYKIELEEAYQALQKVEGIPKHYSLIKEKIEKVISDKIKPAVEIALKDKKLTPEEEKSLKNLFLMHTDLNENEINEQIETFLAEFDAVRGKESDDFNLIGNEKIFFYEIKKFLRDNFLSLEKENKIKEISKRFKISNNRFEELLILALKDTKDSEREKTIQSDKLNYRSFCYEILKNNSIDEKDQPYPIVIDQINQTEDTNEPFFPLSHQTRKFIFADALHQYKDDLKNQKEKFYTYAENRLQKYSEHNEALQQLLTEQSFHLLLTDVRRPICESIIQKINEKQRHDFEDEIKKFFQLQHWNLSQTQIDSFLKDKKERPSSSSVIYDWLTENDIFQIIKKTQEWATEEKQKEIKLIKNKLKKELEKYPFGLPVSLQLELEKNPLYFLAQDERNIIIREMEQPLRKEAEKIFIKLVEEKLVYGTIIPAIEEKLLSKGNLELILNDEKNKISYQVKTAIEILNEKRKPIEEVINNQVKQISNSKKIEADLIEKYHLSDEIFLPEGDLEIILSRFNPENDSQKEHLRKLFHNDIEKEKVIIRTEENFDKFSKDILEPKVNLLSQNYKLSIQEWYSVDFENEMVHVSSAYGIDSYKMKSHLNYIYNSYKSWILPNWLNLIKWFAIIMFGMVLFRWSTFPSGANNWVFEKPIQWDYLSFWSGFTYENFVSYQNWIPFPDFNFDLLKDWWLLFQIIAGIFLLLFYLLWLVIALIVNLFPVLIFIISNLFIIIYNIILFLTFLLSNFGIILVDVLLFLYYSLSYLITRFDYILAVYPSQVGVMWSWFILSVLIAAFISFYLNVKGLKRSYKKQVKIGLISVGSILSVFMLISFLNIFL